jgi:hypothetical protein
MDWRAILLAVVGLIAPFIYAEIFQWDAGFPITEGTFTDLLVWAFGWIFNLLGLTATGAGGYRLLLQRKLNKSGGHPILVGKINVRKTEVKQ